MSKQKDTIQKIMPIQLSEMEQMINHNKISDLRNKMKMAKKVAMYVQMSIKMANLTPSFLEIDPKLYTKLKEKNKFYKSLYFRNLDVQGLYAKLLINGFSYMDIRELLLENYVVDHAVINKEKLKVELEQSSVRCEDDSFNSFLNHLGFIWIPLPGTNKSILVEHPKRVLDRQRYFKRLQQYRNENRPIVYIEEKYYIGNTFDENRYNLKQGKWCIVVVTPNKLLTANLYLYLSRTTSRIYNWINDELIPILPHNSVVVIEDSLNCELEYHQFPNGVNDKEEIKKWLDENNIPYEDAMPKAELIRLVNRYTKEKSVILDVILNASGHDVLRRQKGFPNLSVILPVTNYLKSNKVKPHYRKASFGNIILDTLKGCTEAQWREMFEHVKAQENKIFEEDCAMEEVIEKLMYMTSHEGDRTEANCLQDYEKELSDYVTEKKDLQPSNLMATAAFDKVTHVTLLKKGNV